MEGWGMEQNRCSWGVHWEVGMEARAPAPSSPSRRTVVRTTSVCPTSAWLSASQGTFPPWPHLTRGTPCPCPTPTAAAL